MDSGGGRMWMLFSTAVRSRVLELSLRQPMRRSALGLWHGHLGAVYRQYFSNWERADFRTEWGGEAVWICARVFLDAINDEPTRGAFEDEHVPVVSSYHSYIKFCSPCLRFLGFGFLSSTSQPSPQSILFLLTPIPTFVSNPIVLFAVFFSPALCFPILRIQGIILFPLGVELISCNHNIAALTWFIVVIRTTTTFVRNYTLNVDNMHSANLAVTPTFPPLQLLLWYVNHYC